MKQDRRSFIKTGLGYIFLAGISSDALAHPQEKPAQKKDLPENQKINSTGTFDVCIIGAGPAGISAAISAARNSANVLLLERDALPGGAPVNMYVTYLCGGPITGIFKEVTTQLNKYHTLGGVPSPTFNPESGRDQCARWWHPSAFARVFLDQIRKQNRQNKGKITLLCQSQVTDIIKNGNKVCGVRFMSNGEYFEASAKVTIEASGFGNISEKAGCEAMYGLDAKKDFNEPIGSETKETKIMPCTWMFITHRIRKGAILPYFENNDPNGKKRLYGSCVEDMNDWIKDTSYIARDKGAYLHWGVGLNDVDTRNQVSLSDAQSAMFDKLQKRGDIALIQNNGFTIEFAPRIGVRECRRIKGDYVLTVNELGVKGTPYHNNGFVPHDMIAEGSYYLDAWGMDPPIPEEYKKTTLYGIPLRCCIPLHVEGFMTAGRIISGTHLAMSSYRVQPIVSSIGYGAGAAAAIAALKHDGNVRQVNGAALRKQLSDEGLFAYKEINENR